MSENLSGFCEDVFEKRIAVNNETITDDVFFLIQNDRELMHRYLRLVDEKTLDVVNRAIGRAVKVHFDLTNADDRQCCPRSTLIQSNQKFKKDE